MSPPACRLGYQGKDSDVTERHNSSICLLGVVQDVFSRGERPWVLQSIAVTVADVVLGIEQGICGLLTALAPVVTWTIGLRSKMAVWRSRLTLLEAQGTAVEQLGASAS